MKIVGSNPRARGTRVEKIEKNYRPEVALEKVTRREEEHLNYEDVFQISKG